MSGLQVIDVTAGYGQVVVLHGIHLSVGLNSRVALVGSNGAGKSTLVKAINGLLPILGGDILWNGRSIARLAPADRVRAGIGTVAEGRLLFSDCTVAENLFAAATFGEPAKVKHATRSRVFELFPRLQERSLQRAGTLSGGEQQMLAIGRALMTLPKLLVLDEPSIGLSPKIISEIFTVLSSLTQEGLSMLLVEQNIQLSLRTVDRGAVLQQGRLTLEGTSAELLANPEVGAAYLGT
jgi:branched-chain amino acid transport system ATP-binding protein